MGSPSHCEIERDTRSVMREPGSRNLDWYLRQRLDVKIDHDRVHLRIGLLLVPVSLGLLLLAGRDVLRGRTPSCGAVERVGVLGRPSFGSGRHARPCGLDGTGSTAALRAFDRGNRIVDELDLDDGLAGEPSLLVYHALPQAGRVSHLAVVDRQREAAGVEERRQVRMHLLEERDSRLHESKGRGP